MKNQSHSRVLGFTIIEILIAIAVIGILAGVLATVSYNVLDGVDLSAERTNLTALRADIENSFTNTDMSRNVGALAGTGIDPVASQATATDDPNTIVMTNTITVNTVDWRAKVATLRGQSPVGGATVTQPTDSSGAMFNDRRWARILLAGPINETGSQRFLLISVMTSPSRPLIFPASDPNLFNEIWANSWDTSSAVAPTTWNSYLAAADYALWNATSSNNRTNANRLLVQRIVQMKYTLTVADTHPSDDAWVDIGPFSNAMHVVANSGTSGSQNISSNSTVASGEFATGIPAGRQIVVRRGATAATAVEVQRFAINGPVTVTIQ